MGRRRLSRAALNFILVNEVKSDGGEFKLPDHYLKNIYTFMILYQMMTK